MADYRERIKPNQEVMSRLDSRYARGGNKTYVREAVSMLVCGYTRDEIAERFGRSIKNVSATIHKGKKRLGAKDDIALTLICHGIPIKNSLPLSPYMASIEAGHIRLNRFAHKAIDLLVRGYSRSEIGAILGKKPNNVRVVILKNRDKSNMGSWIELTLLAYDLIDGREFCLKLPESKVSGTLRGNAEQLPGGEAQGSPKTGHADLVGSDRADGDLGGMPVLPRER